MKLAVDIGTIDQLAATEGEAKDVSVVLKAIGADTSLASKQDNCHWYRDLNIGFRSRSSPFIGQSCRKRGWRAKICCNACLF